MSTEFDRLLSDGFKEVIRITSDAGTGDCAATLTRNGRTVPVVTTPVAQTKELRDSGYWPGFHCIAEIFRSDFRALGLADRVVVTFMQADQTPLPLKIIGIEDDPADPCIKLTLKEQPPDAQ